MNKEMVDIQSLTHQYADRVALDDVSFSVEQGTIFGILGPNGGGKTTLFKILTTLLPPTKGCAYIAGSNVATDRADVRSRIGVVFQNPSLDKKLTVLENLHHQGHLFGITGKTLRDRSVKLLSRFGIDDRAREFVEKLSGGLQRRVELAKAMLHKPAVLILDEPSTGLDPAARMDLMNALKELQAEENVTTLLTTHYLDEADRTDRVAILDLGKLKAHDTPTSLKKAVGNEVLTVSSQDPESLQAGLAKRFDLQGEVLGDSIRIECDEGRRFVPELIEAFPGEVEAVTVGRPTLDDVFVHFTGHRIHNESAENMIGRGTRS